MTSEVEAQICTHMGSIARNTKSIAQSLEYITSLLSQWEPVMRVALAEAKADLAENQKDRK